MINNSDLKQLKEIAEDKGFAVVHYVERGCITDTTKSTIQTLCKVILELNNEILLIKRLIV